jgi:cytosine/adenosine deaminase-related metal-dependent hydrolase
MFQSLTRAVPAAQNAELFGWLRTLYPMWARLTPEMIATSTQLAMAELLLSGCTTSSDHLYLYPNGVRLDDSIAAAQQIGMRFHACRGSMSVGESAGGLPPDSLVEREADILRDSQRLIETFHDDRRHAMVRIALAPCSPFSVSPELMRESARLARSSRRGIRLHTHLAENDHDIAYSREKFGMTPTEYAESLGWLGDDVWHAHCVKLDGHGIGRFAATGTGVAHCPASNMRLGSGIAPVPQMLAAGVPVGLGVDGSASNDASDMLGEVRQALLLHRVMGGAKAITAREVLRVATRGGAQVLGYSDLGAIEEGALADLVLIDLEQIGLAGALHDPVAAPVFAGDSHIVACSIVNGEIVVEKGRLVRVSEAEIIRRANEAAAEMVRSAQRKTGIPFLEFPAGEELH